MGSRLTRTIVALLAVIAAYLLPAAGAEAATGGACSAGGVDSCPAGTVGRPALTVEGAGARSSALAPPAPEGAVMAGPSIFTGYGFDACTAPSSRSMRAWRESSPFEAIGVYIGGRNRGCTQPNLTATWVGEQVANGWHLIPLYVGLQATTSSCTSCAMLNSSFAAVQGEAEAEDAVSDAQAVGIGPGSPIYHDMESYTRTATATGVDDDLPRRLDPAPARARLRLGRLQLERVGDRRSGPPLGDELHQPGQHLERELERARRHRGPQPQHRGLAEPPADPPVPGRPR